MAGEQQENIYINKVAIMQVLAGLIKNPLLFLDSNYKFSIDDFPEQFHKIVFGAIQYLANNGLKTIDYIDIDKFLQPYATQYKVFTDNKGVDYINRILQIYNPDKFNYYYNTLKKYSLISYLNSKDINTLDLYNPNIINPTEQQKMQENFDKLSVNDIILTEELKIIDAKEKFGSNSDVVENKFGDSLLELKEHLKQIPEVGLPLSSPILTTLYRGQRLGCFVMESGAAGTGKTRRAIGEACHLAIREYYDTDAQKWVDTKLEEKVLVINTELELNEVQTMAIAYVSGVPENHILDGKYYGDEEERVNKAIEVINQSNLYFVSVTNFDCDDVIDIIKKYYQRHNVRYVYFDYLSENMKLLAEGTRKTRVQGLRTDQILLQFSSALKDCAKQLGIYIWTSTQLSGNYKETKDPDASLLRSAKALSDKTDVGTIMLPIRESDKPVIDSYCAKGFEIRPTMVFHIYKIRRGTYQNIRYYAYFDRSTCRIHDCFVTDNTGTILPVKPTEVEIETLIDNASVEKFEDAYTNIDFEF